MIAFILAHAGGSASTYVPLFNHLANIVSFEPLDLPGHGQRADEMLLNNMGEIIADVKGRVHKVLDAAPDESYVFLGHSMGTQLSFLLAMQLEEEGRPPAHLYLSSGLVPGRHYIPKGFLELCDTEFWEACADHFGGMSPDVVMSTDLQKLFVPILRADLRAIVEFVPPTEMGTGVPITVMWGDNEMMDAADADIWRRHTTADFRRHSLVGNHFHILQKPEAVERIVLDSLLSILP